MFELGGGLQEILLILVVALLVVGPKRLPEVGRMLARAMRELRSASDEFRSTLETHLEINEPVVRPLPVPPDRGMTSASIAREPVATSTIQPLLDESVDDEASTPYVARRGGRLFHQRECRWASCVGRNDRLVFLAAADAEREGFVSCPACEEPRQGSDRA